MQCKRLHGKTNYEYVDSDNIARHPCDLATVIMKTQALLCFVLNLILKCCQISTKRTGYIQKKKTTVRPKGNHKTYVKTIHVP